MVLTTGIFNFVTKHHIFVCSTPYHSGQVNGGHPSGKSGSVMEFDTGKGNVMAH